MGCRECGRSVRARGLCFSHWRAVRWAEVPGLEERELEARRLSNAGVRKKPEPIDRDDFWAWVVNELSIKAVK